MKTGSLLFIKCISFLCCVFYCGDLICQVNPLVNQVKLDESNKTINKERLQQQPLLFIENRGQVADVSGKLRPDILFTSQSDGAKLFFTANAIHYQFTKTEFLKERSDSIQSDKLYQNYKMDVLGKKIQQSIHRFSVALQGANPNPSIKKEQQTDYYENYYMSHCPDGITGVKSYQKITFENVYPGIDWVIYSNEGFMKYDFVVHAGADRSLIKLKVKDADAVTISSNGELLIKTKLGEVKEKQPVSFNAAGKKINTRFIQNSDGTLGFYADAEPGIYMRIDPSVIWATYYGGGGVVSLGYSCAVDASDNVYLSGETYSASGIATAGGFDNTFDNTYSGNQDAFLVKFNSSGTRLWATYYGYNSQEKGTSVAVDGSGNVYLAGSTNSLTGIGSGGFQNTFGGAVDAFLIKFNSSGSRLWATYYGGAEWEFQMTCAVDGSNNVYLAGYTTSPTGIASGGFKNTLTNSAEMFLVKFNNIGNRLWATYYGSVPDFLNGTSPSCTVDGSNNVYLASFTKSATGIASGGYQNTYQGGSDAILVKFSSSGSRLWATYYGSVSDEYGLSCAVDGSNNVYLAGYTYSTTGIASSGFQNTHGGDVDAFLVKFNSSGARLWATYYGGSDGDFGSACAVDGNNNVYLVGSAYSVADIACGGFKNSGGGYAGDVFVAKFNSDGARYWGSYYGGTGGGEYASACTIDGSDNLYIAGYTNSATGIASGGHQNTKSGPYDAFLVKIEGSVIVDPALNLVPVSGILYVDKTKSGNGSSWASAASEVAHALKAAQSNPLITQIWVAKGTYAPMHNPSVSASCPNYNHIDNAFLLVNNVKIYGGFSGNGTETSITQRNIARYPTILSGNRNYHIVISAGSVGTAELNGFIIEKGKANGSADITVNGQIVYRSNGGGLYMVGSSPRIENCIIRDNSAKDNGGGLYAANSAANLTSNKISGNTAGNGGGAYLNNTAVTLVNCLLSGNKVSGFGGGIYNNALLQTPVIRNSTIASNLAVTGGGGLYFTGFPIPASPPLVYNSIIYSNRIGVTVSNFTTNSATAPEVRYSIIENNLDYTNSGNNLTGTSPQFINPKDASLAPINTGNYSLNKCSPAINTGNNIYIAGYPNDLAGTTRILNTTVDRGAYENNSAVSAVPDMAGVVYVDRTKSGNGSTWENAVPELSDALLAARTNTDITAIWVAKGTYYPLYDIAFTCVPADERDKAFVLINNVKLWGGFAGGETMVSQRNYALNETILSGDIGVEGIRSDNSYHVVVSAGAVGNAVINGFTIQDGQATGTGTVAINGFNFSRNSCGGMYIISSSPDVTACAIKNNTANGFAAGVYVSVSNAIFTNCSISGNNALGSGGGIYSNNPNGGSSAYPRFYHCTVSGNRGSSGGGGYFTTLGTEPAKMYNCIFYGNKNNAGVASNDIISSVSTSDDPEVYYSIVGNVASTTAYANMAGNSTANPLLTYQEDAMNAPNLAGNFRLQKCSPAINTGSNTYAAGITRDLDFNARTTFFTVDMGAYEKVLALPDTNGIVYVDSSNILNNGDGSSWEKSVADLADALKAAKTNTAIKQIWTAKGTYKPLYIATDDGSLLSCPSVNRDNAFVMVNDVKLYGGFAGGETDTTGRDYILNECILSGDIDDINFNNPFNDAHHIVISAGAIGTASLDGFTVKGGYANGAGTISVNGQTIERIYGGGMYNGSSAPLIINSKFINNTTTGSGAGIYNKNSSSIISNCFISENTAVQGGGITNRDNSYVNISDCTFSNNFSYNEGGGLLNFNTSYVTITDCIFIQNTANYGAGIANVFNAEAVISNCLFANNVVDFDGGALHNSNSNPIISNCSILGNSAAQSGGGMSNILGSSPIVSNCLFSGNTAALNGGALYNYSQTTSVPEITNSSFSGNKATLSGGAIYNGFTPPFDMAIPVIKNSIIWGNTASSTNAIFPITGLPDISNNIIEGGYASGTNIFDLDPLFVNPQLAAAAPTTLGDYRLQTCSPALNIGDNSFIQPGVTKDLDSLDRIKYTTVDLGAYEKQDIDLGNTTWKGVNTNWNDKVNWCGGYIPFDTTNVVIPSSLSNYPVINTGYYNGVKNILLGSGSSVGLQNNGSLSIYGTYTNNGSTINNKGKWVMAGDSTGQYFPGTLATVSAMNHLEIKKPSGVTFNKSFSITGSLIPTAGNIDVNNVEVTLKSSDTATASVDVIQPGASISYTGTGAFIVERFINTGVAAGQHQKTWQFLSTPATGQSIHQAWQETGFVPAGYGTWITGTGTGFDATTALPSLKYFNEAAVNWTAVTNTGNALVNKLGYMLFVRGDRTVTTYNGTPNNTILRSMGQLYSPTNPAPSVTVSANKFQTFGNPYASRIEFSKLYDASTGINDVFYVWDPKLAGSYNVGGYQTISGITGYIPTVGTPPTGNAATDYYPAGVPSPYIESGQAVFVKGNGSGGQVNFNENVKATGSRLVNRPAPAEDPMSRRQFLFTSLFTNTGVIADGNIVAFEKGFGNEVNDLDAGKIMNAGENFGLMRDGSILAVEAHDPVKESDTIFYSLGNLRRQPYQLRFAPVNMGSVNHQPYLIDRFTRTITPLSLTDSSFVDFTVTADAVSSAADRFIIVFRLKSKPKALQPQFGYEEQLKGTKPANLTVQENIIKSIKVFPNPVADGNIQLWFTGMPAGIYQVRMYNNAGQQLLTRQLMHQAETEKEVIRFTGNMARGVYQLDITDPDGEKTKHTVIF